MLCRVRRKNDDIFDMQGFLLGNKAIGDFCGRILIDPTCQQRMVSDQSEVGLLLHIPNSLSLSW